MGCQAPISMGGPSRGEARSSTAILSDLQQQRGIRLAVAAGDVTQATNIKRTAGTAKDLELAKPWPDLKIIKTMKRVSNSFISSYSDFIFSSAL